MNIAIYSDRVLTDFFGGAEMYSIWFALIFSKYHNITLICDGDNESTSRKDFLKSNFFITKNPNISIKKIHGVGPNGNPPKKEYEAHNQLIELTKGKQDIFINISNNLVPGMPNIDSFAIIHFPVFYHWFLSPDQKYCTWINNLYTKSYKRLIANSKFTKTHVEDIYKCSAEYCYPPVSLNNSCCLEKKCNSILAVGRIDRDKQIELLADAFIRLTKETKDKLTVFSIAGFCRDKHYLNQLKNSYRNYNINFYNDVSDKELCKLYSESKIFWHAKGYEEKDPSLFEHFGISTVEAMSHGCVPITYGAGGQKEIINNRCGYLWNTIDELTAYTKALISDKDLFASMSTSAVERSKDFAPNKFFERMSSLIIP